MDNYLVEIWVPPVYIEVEGKDEDDAFEQATQMINTDTGKEFLMEKVEEIISDCEVGEIRYN